MTGSLEKRLLVNNDVVDCQRASVVRPGKRGENDLAADRASSISGAK
jgi:hypothetical protein